MMNRFLHTMVLLTGLCAISAATAQNPYVIDSAGQKIEGDSLVADEQGNLRLQIGAAVRSFSQGQYESAFTPKPKEVEALESMLDNQRYDVILERGGQVFDKYKYLGWAGRLAYIRAEALLATDEPERALDILDSAERYVNFNQTQVQMARVNALLETGKATEAEKILAELKKNEADKVAAFAFNATAELLVQKNRKKDAVLEYLKTILVIEPGEADHEQNKAREEVVKLLKEMGDPRYEQFE